MSESDLLHSMCTMGNSDVYTIKLLLFCPSTSNQLSITLLKWSQSDKPVFQIGRQWTPAFNDQKISGVEFYISDLPSCTQLKITTNCNYELKKENIYTMTPSRSGKRNWYNFAHIDIKDKYLSVTIQINITFKKEIDDTLPKLCNLRKDSIFTDAVIESCDGVAFKIHKCILAVRSDVFKALFTHSSTSTIKSNFEESVLTELLNFIYCGINGVNIDLVANALLHAADFYQINDLKSYCEYTLFTQLTKDNVIDIIMDADLYSAVNLKNLAMNFLECNALAVFTTTAWSNLKSPEILKALYQSTKDIIKYTATED